MLERISPSINNGVARLPDPLSQDPERGTFRDAPSRERDLSVSGTGIQYSRPMSGAETSTRPESALRLGSPASENVVRCLPR
jgi:hypothetical protein